MGVRIQANCLQHASFEFLDTTRYYFRPVNEAMRYAFSRAFPGKMTAPLGAEKLKMREQWVKLFCGIEDPSPATGTVAVIGDRFLRDELPRLNTKTGRPLYAPSTSAEYERIAKNLRNRFGDRRYARSEADAVTGPFLRTMHIDAYLRENEKTRPEAANHEVTCFSRMFTCARRWGLTEYNPCLGAERNSSVPRDVVPADAAFLAVYAKATPELQCMMDLAQMCGPRRGAIAAITLADEREEGLLVTANKTKRGSIPKKTLYQWSHDLRAVIDRAKELRKRRRGSRRVESIHLFPTRKGEQYTKNALDSLWARALERADISRASFHFHDIKAKTVTESADLVEAMKRAAHSDIRTTRRVYDRKPDVVTPLPSVSRKGTDRKPLPKEFGNFCQLPKNTG